MGRVKRVGQAIVAFAVVVSSVAPAVAQVAPSVAEKKAYRGLFAAAVKNDANAIRSLLGRKADPNARDAHGRTPAMVAAHLSNDRALTALLRGGTDANLLDDDRYDIITIAAVNNDGAIVRVAIANGGKATNITSRYDGTALIAAAHLGNEEAVRELLKGRPRLNHVNNLGWTAMLEAVILGDGGLRHQDVVRQLLAAGADRTIADGSGLTPLDHAKQRGYTSMIALLTN